MTPSDLEVVWEGDVGQRAIQAGTAQQAAVGREGRVC